MGEQPFFPEEGKAMEQCVVAIMMRDGREQREENSNQRPRKTGAPVVIHHRAFQTATTG